MCGGVKSYIMHYCVALVCVRATCVCVSQSVPFTICQVFSPSTIFPLSLSPTSPILISLINRFCRLKKKVAKYNTLYIISAKYSNSSFLTEHLLLTLLRKNFCYEGQLAEFTVSSNSNSNISSSIPSVILTVISHPALTSRETCT